MPDDLRHFYFYLKVIISIRFQPCNFRLARLALKKLRFLFSEIIRVIIIEKDSKDNY